MSGGNDPAGRASTLIADDTLDSLRVLSGMLAAEGYPIRLVLDRRLAPRAVRASCRT